MNIYNFSAAGLALSAKLAIVATTEAEAMEVARLAAERNCVDPDTLRLEFTTPFNPPCAVYVWNGDY